MYADMMRRMAQKDVDQKKKEKKAAIAQAADKEVFPRRMICIILSDGRIKCLISICTFLC